MSPWSPQKPCPRSGCPGFREGEDRYCKKHQAEFDKRQDADRGSSSKRGYGGKWRRLRKIILARDPICKACECKFSKHVDHVIPKQQGGTDDESNLQGLCHRCHSEKTAHETQWGKR